MHFHYMTYMATPQHKNPCPGGDEIYKFGRPFLGYHNYILSLSVLCLGVEMKIFKGILHFHYMTYMGKPPPQGFMKFTVLVDPSLVIITIHSLYEPCTGQRIRFLKKCINFTLFTPKLPPLGAGMIFTISCLLSLHMLQTKFD